MMRTEYEVFLGYIKEILRDKVRPLFEQANIDLSEYDKLEFHTNLEEDLKNYTNFIFAYDDEIEKVMILMPLSHDKFISQFFDESHPCDNTESEQQMRRSAEMYIEENESRFAHEIGHFLDYLVRGKEEIHQERKEYVGDKVIGEDEDDASSYDYFSHPAEMIAIISEIKLWKLQGLNDDQIIRKLKKGFSLPESYIKSLISMAKKKEERTVFGKYITIIAVEQDTSGTVLNQWLDAGFREVVWIYQEEPWQDNKKWLEMGGTCPTCMALGGQHFKIQDLLADMTHDAPKYSKSHVGCKCLMKRIPREEEILDYPEETPITEESPKAEELPKAEEIPAVEEPPKPEETQNP